MNNSFAELDKVLPSYDPSKSPSKSAIIEESVKYIKELEEKLKALVNPASAASAERELATYVSLTRKRSNVMGLLHNGCGIKCQLWIGTYERVNKLALL